MKIPLKDHMCLHQKNTLPLNYPNEIKKRHIIQDIKKKKKIKEQ